MQDEEKRFRTALAGINAGVASFEALMAEFGPLQERVGKGHAIMPREIGAIIEKGKTAVAAAKTGLGVINALTPEQEPATEPQPSVAAPAENPQPTSTAAAGEAPSPSIPEVEPEKTPESAAEAVHVPE